MPIWNSYKISLKQVSLGGNIRNNHVSLGMEQDDDWILCAAYNDPERMRNTFSVYLVSNGYSTGKFWHGCRDNG